jgi:short-subunit dehydrogenase
VPNRLSELYRTAFVSGASTGLGRAFAEMLLAEGVRVWGTSRDAARLTGFSGRGAGAFTPMVLDLRDGEAAERAFLDADRDAGGFDIVINNAGYGVFGSFAGTDFGVWQQQIEVMLVNTARLAHAALRQMRTRSVQGRRAALVNISSLAAEFPLPFQPAYNMCKAGLTALNESLMIETRGGSIIILDVRPGDYRTDFEGAVVRPAQLTPDERLGRAWAGFERMMRTGPLPDHAAQSLRRALRRGRSGTVRTGRFFQAVVGPFVARFGSLALNRRVMARYFGLS